MHDPIALAARYHEALNNYDPGVVAPMFAHDAVYVSPGVGDLSGRDAIVAAFSAYFAEYSDQVAEDDEMKALDGGRVCSRWRLTATSRHTGQLAARRGMEIITFDDAGLIRRVEVEDQ